MLLVITRNLTLILAMGLGLAAMISVPALASVTQSPGDLEIGANETVSVISQKVPYDMAAEYHVNSINGTHYMYFFNPNDMPMYLHEDYKTFIASPGLGIEIEPLRHGPWDIVKQISPRENTQAISVGESIIDSSSTDRFNHIDAHFFHYLIDRDEIQKQEIETLQGQLDKQAKKIKYLETAIAKLQAQK